MKLVQSSESFLIIIILHKIAWQALLWTAFPAGGVCTASKKLLSSKLAGCSTLKRTFVYQDKGAFSSYLKKNALKPVKNGPRSSFNTVPRPDHFPSIAQKSALFEVHGCFWETTQRVVSVGLECQTAFYASSEIISIACHTVTLPITDTAIIIISTSLTGRMSNILPDISIPKTLPKDEAINATA